MNNSKYIRQENGKYCVVFPMSLKNPRRLGRYDDLGTAVKERDGYLISIGHQKIDVESLPELSRLDSAEKSNTMKRVVVISDLHCGHFLGLTHPDYDQEPMNKESAAYKIFMLRREYYDCYREIIQSLQPIDVLIVNGDAIDGRGERSGSTELIAIDRSQQVDMAVAVIQECNADKIFMSYGTAYHTGNCEDYENLIARQVNADIQGHGWISVNGLVIGYRHDLGSSSSPYSRYTSLAKEKVWNILKSQYDEFPKSDIIIRSHVHYYVFCGGYSWFGCTTPALQGYGSKYGERKMSGTVEWGLIHFDIESKDKWSWQSHIVKAKRTVIKPTII